MSGHGGARKDLAALGLLALLAAAFWWEAFTLRGLVYSGDFTGSDLLDLNLPYRFYLAEALRAGTLPLWAPDIASGFPLLAEGQAGALYPSNLLLYALLPPLVAFNWSIVLHTWLAGAGTYAFARELRLGRQAALIGAATFMFCGFLVVRVKHVNLVDAAVWLPLLLCLLARTFRERRLPLALAAGAVVAVQILAGHPHMTFYCLCATVAWLLFLAGERLWDAAHAGEALAREAGWAAAALALLLGAGVGLAAAQILPTLELVGLSSRAGGMSWEIASDYPYHPANLLTFLAPYYYGNPATAGYRQDLHVMGVFWENCAYVGLLPLALAAAALALRLGRDRRVAFWAAAVAVALLLAMGKHTPLYYVLWAYVPGFGLFRFPTRFLLVAELGLALLAAYGWDEIRRWLARPALARGLAVAALLLILADLFRFGRAYNVAVDPAVWLAPPPTVPLLARDPDRFRVFTVAPGRSWGELYDRAGGWRGDQALLARHRAMLPPDYNMLFRVASMSDRAVREGGLGVARRAELENFLVENIARSGVAVAPPWTRLLGAHNVKYLLASWDLAGPRLRLAGRVDEEPLVVRVYENLDWLPRARIVPQARVIAPGQDTAVALLSTDFRRQVLLEADPGWGDAATTGTATIAAEAAGEVAVDAELSGRGFLVLADVHYPGWRAYVDGRETPILRANYAFRALPLDRGRHQVRFVYAPSSVRIGAAVSAMTLLVVLFCLSRRPGSKSLPPASEGARPPSPPSGAA